MDAPLLASLEFLIAKKQLFSRQKVLAILEIEIWQAPYWCLYTSGYLYK